MTVVDSGKFSLAAFLPGLINSVNDDENQLVLYVKWLFGFNKNKNFHLTQRDDGSDVSFLHESC